MLISDFNSEPIETTVSDFCEIYNLTGLNKDKACFKNPNKPTYSDLIVTNRSKYFQDTMVIATGLSKHKMTIAVMKTDYNQQKPSIIQ